MRSGFLDMTADQSVDHMPDEGAREVKAVKSVDHRVTWASETECDEDVMVEAVLFVLA